MTALLNRIKDWAGGKSAEDRPAPTMNELLRQAGEQPREVVLPGKGVASTMPHELASDIRLRPEMAAPTKSLGNVYDLVTSPKLDWDKVTLADGPGRAYQDPERTRNERQANFNQMPKIGQQQQPAASRASAGHSMER